MTPPAPPRDSPAGRAFNDLRNLAKRQRRDPFEYYTLYALEGFLARMTASTQADHFVLKGGVLMAAFAARRPTRDIDVAASGISGDVSDVMARVREVVAERLEDGLEFDDHSVRAEEIRQDAAYAGVRVHMVAILASARIPLHVDVNFGDPIWPGATQTILPRLLGGTLTVQGYPDHMVLAEKIVTAIERGSENTRWRDFVDIASITSTRTIEADMLRHAMGVCADYRQAKLESLGPVAERMSIAAQAKWAVWRRKQRLGESTPESFADLLLECVRFCDPVLSGSATNATWDPRSRTWVSPRQVVEA
ncbi:nucleotidyl transferase AbiEii/AbiGii toxin family protein [Tessaracoccus palaemonis]|uniref:Nucleotidyl transferase AbiEii/AbiGii toxin family protein n=1 Tax=Tessaracoccus palaemonis TaxID=2829499 RepID=A0ABX8SNS2_9ACTN|nr:nucleotidyl transferase AbiEii/AbiGii toxin family protein [Tessaracoccus palaemonis]QXT64050.1 nucleotidyl transferase AbiEii/AbiGii toxin family protein [Tessaracoccus palaemonis]